MSIKASSFVQILKSYSFNNISGVPDSTFGNLYNLIDQDPDINYFRANREDTALGISSGFSVSNKNSCIIIQNSGIGNIINPLTSFNLIYKIPILIIVGWRGFGGKPNDAPEHWIMGEKTTEYFKMLNIPFACFEDTQESQEGIEKKLTPKTKIISITHLSNVTGAILPVKEITELAHSKGIIVVVDGCQGAPHLKLDMQDLDCDFYAISCHKMYGPTGLGVLYGKKKWLEELPPYQGGGGMINEVKKDNITFAEAYTKFEAGTMQTAEVVAFAEALNFIEDIGIKKIASHENEIFNNLIKKIR